MSFLASLLVGIFDVILGRAIRAIQAWNARRKKAAELKAKIKAERDSTDAAQTPEEREHAADNNRRI